VGEYTGYDIIEYCKENGFDYIEKED